MKKFQDIINIFFSIVIVFILFNIVLSIAWEIRTSLKLKNSKPYTDEVLQILNLNKSDGLTLYLETWINRKYEYDQFVEWREKETLDQKFVNVSAENGRKISGNNNCENNFYFYGGSTTFGYNVTDSQTISAYFKEILNEIHSKKNYCVYNFGRAGYASPWENILFQKHLANKKIKQNNFVFFIDGVNERGNADGINSKFFYESQKALGYKYWDIYKPTLKLFFESLPLMQFISRIQQKYMRTPESFNCEPDEMITNINYKTQCQPLKNVQITFQHNVNVRNAICEKFNINCYTFLQPFSLVHGNYFKKYKKSGAPETGMIKNFEEFSKKQKRDYEYLKKTKNIIDISDSLKLETDISYVDRSHYSPSACKAIAKYIYAIVKDKLI